MARGYIVNSKHQLIWLLWCLRSCYPWGRRFFPEQKWLGYQARPSRLSSLPLEKCKSNQAHSLSSIHVQENSKLLNASCSICEQYLQNKFLLVFSAHNRRTLKENMKGLGVCGQYEMMDFAYTLGTRRSKPFERAFVMANQEPSGGNFGCSRGHKAQSKMNANSNAWLRIKRWAFVTAETGLRLTSVDPGQGTQWPQMGVRSHTQLPDLSPYYICSRRHSPVTGFSSWMETGRWGASSIDALVLQFRLSLECWTSF